MDPSFSAKRSDIDLVLVEGLVLDHLDVRRITVSPLPGFAGNLNVLIRSAEERWVLKCCSREELAAESVAIGLASEQGVPVPDIVASDDRPDSFPSPYVLMRFCTGGPVSGDAGLRDAGRCVAALHRVRLPEFGHLKGARHPTKQAELSVVAKSVVGLGESHVLSKQTTRATLDVLNRIAEIEISGPRLVHGDLHPRHVLAEHDTVRAVIDWADAAGGDPLMDLARLSMSSPDRRPPKAFMSSYTRVHKVPEDLDDLLARYRVLWSVHALLWEIEAGGDWIAPLVSGIEVELTMLNST